jgi:hypothetical protein
MTPTPIGGDSDGGDPLERWLAALVEGDLSASARQQLGERLKRDPAARQRYVDYLMVHGMLRWEFTRTGALPAVASAPLAQELSVEATRPPVRRARTLRLPRAMRPRSWSALVASAAAAAVIAVILWQAELLPIATGPATIAEVAGATAADGRSLRPGALDNGPFVLGSGLARLAFRSGATLMVEGPAEIDVRSPMLAMLRRGRVVVRVPDAAHGFAIESDGLRVVDLGTEFGIAATPGALPVVQVFAGAVEVGRRGVAPTRLTFGHAVRAAPDGTLIEVDPTAQAFTRALPGDLDATGLDRGLVGWWKLDETSGTVAADASGRNHPGTLRNARFEDVTTPGRLGGALNCDGVGTHIVVPYHHDFDLRTLSIQAWMRPEKVQGGDAQILSKYCSYGLAMPRNETFKFYFWHMDHIISYRLPAQRWYHLCGVFDGRQRIFYLDGAEIAAVTSAPPPFSDGDIQIGALRGEISPNAAFFHGVIDDVRLYDRALSADEVRRLFLIGNATPQR